jgi:hypothetical protein
MSRATKKERNANKANTDNDEARLFFSAVREAVGKARDVIATSMVTSATGGSSTAMKLLMDAITFSEPPKEPSRIETLKKLAALEQDVEYAELSEETADGYPSGREPE